MKRCITTILFTMLCCMVYGQHIRTQFYGEQLGGHRDKAYDNLDDSGYDPDFEKEQLTAYKVDFAGMKWQFLKMNYRNEKLYEVLYITYSRKKKKAIDIFDTLCASLQNKYDGCYTKDEGNGGKSLYCFDKNIGLALNIYRQKNNPLWYVTLSYFDISLKSASLNARDTDL